MPAKPVQSSYDDGESDSGKEPPIDWTRVPRIGQQVDKINTITDDGDRLAAAEDWYVKLGHHAFDPEKD